MNKILSLLTVSIMLLSIVLSVSPMIKSKIISIVGHNNQASLLMMFPLLSLIVKEITSPI